MNLFWAIILVVIGLAVLIKGADWLVDGAVAVARHFGMGPLIIGLTIVAMGTSAPEVAASVGFSLSNAADAAIGNVYGSNVANLALVGGLCALIRPITVTRLAVLRDIPIMLGVSILLYGLINDWGGTGNYEITRFEGVIMLLLFVGIISYMVYSERKKANLDRHMLADAESIIEKTVPHLPKTMKVSVLLIILGLICLTAGAKMTVNGAIELGQRAGLSEAVIGSTIVAVGTSLPELITCVVASLKGHDDLSIGNLVGSNIFNMLLVIGAASLVSPMSLSAYMAGLDYAWMLGISLLFAAIVFLSKRISRPAGFILLISYVGYLVYLFVFNR